MIYTFTGACFGLILGMFLIMINFYPVSNSEWGCTKEIRINEDMPAQYECVQYTRKESENGSSER